MIDFRYHLISIVAVLLALAIGIATGSGFLGGPLLDELESQSADLFDRNQRLRDTALDLNRRLNASSEALAALEPHLVAGALSAEQVVLIVFEGSDEALIDDVRSALEDAEGRIATTITLSSKFALAEPADRDELTDIVSDSAGSDLSQLRVSAARALGDSLAAVASPDVESARTGGPSARLRLLTARFEEAGFLSIDTEVEGQIVPASPSLVLVGGAEPPPPFDAGGFATAFMSELGRKELPLVAAESVDSTWGVVATLRADDETRDAVWTVDQADTPAGWISVPLALSRAIGRPAEHYGTDPGATEVIPQPTPSG